MLEVFEKGPRAGSSRCVRVSSPRVYWLSQSCQAGLHGSPLLAAPSPEDWPQFRGPTGQGHSSEQGLPIAWSETQNVLWKVPVDGGWSSPVIAGGRVWLTAVNAARTARGEDSVVSLRLVGLDVTSGREVVNVEVFKLQ